MSSPSPTPGEGLDAVPADAGTPSTSDSIHSRTGLRFGRLSYGTAPLGNLFAAVGDDQASAALRGAWSAGIRYFDTAPHYGLGLAERRTGAFLAGRPRDRFVVSTKVGRLLVPVAEPHERDSAWFDVPATAERVWDYSERGIRRSHRDSLARLGLDRVDVLYLHDPEQYGVRDDVPGALRALVRMREEGLVRAVGVGSADLGLLREAIDIADLDLLMVSNRYTLLDSRAGATLAPECRRRGIGIMNAGVFNSGLLATSTPQRTAHYEYGPVPPELFDTAVRLADACRRHDVDLPAAALQYALRDQSVLTAVVGMRSAVEVRENRRRMDARIPDALWADLRATGLLPV